MQKWAHRVAPIFTELNYSFEPFDIDPQCFQRWFVDSPVKEHAAYLENIPNLKLISTATL
jgi:hypothetical protein